MARQEFLSALQLVNPVIRIAMNEGASDEKYAALYAVEKLLIEKKDVVRKFEEEFCDDTSKVAA